jgi:diguanylate cyclase (GGDEF)-like protein
MNDHRDALRVALPHEWRKLVDAAEECCFTDPDGCLQLTLPALARAERGNQVGAVIILSSFSAWASFDQGRVSEAVSRIERAVQLCRQLGDNYWLGRLLTGLGWFLANLDDHQAAVECYEEALQHRSAADDMRGKAATINNLAMSTRWIPGRFARAAELASEAAHLFAAVGDERNEALALSNRAEILLQAARTEGDDPRAARASQLEVAHQAARQAVDSADRVGWTQVMIDARRHLAATLVEVGAIGDASVVVDELGRLLPQEGLPNQWSEYLTLRARLCRMRGDLSQAIELLKEAAGNCARLSRPLHEHAGVHEELVVALESAQRFEEALAALRQYYAFILGVRDRATGQRMEVLANRLDIERLANAARELGNQAQELRELNQELASQALTDPLTQLDNRRSFDAVLAQCLASDQPFALLMVDVDDFKFINDSLSHLVGDAVLQELASVLRQAVRGGDTVFRLGGDEFTVVLPRAGLTAAMVIKGRIQDAVASHNWAEIADGLSVSVTVGAADRMLNDTAASLLRRVDLALLSNKQRVRRGTERQSSAHRATAAP